MAPDHTGQLWATCQKGLFTSPDQGLTWTHVKLETQPHFGELRGLAFADHRLVLATQTGVYVSEPNQFRRLTRVEALGAAKFKQVMAADSRTVWILKDHGSLFKFQPGTAPISLEDWGAGEDPWQHGAVFADGTLTVVSKTQVRQYQGQFWLDITPENPIGGLHATSHSQGLLVWDMVQAWFRRPMDTHWQPVTAWPEAVKQAAISPNGHYALACDRTYIHHLSIYSEI